MDHFVAKSGRIAWLVSGIVALAAIFGAIGMYLYPGIAAGPFQARYPLRVELAPKAAASIAARPTAGEGAATSNLKTAPDEVAAQAAPPEPAARALPTATAKDPAGLLSVDFDLSPDADQSSAPAGKQIEVTKALIVNGREAGSIAVRVGRNSLLYLDRPGLARALRQVDGGLADELSGDTEPFVSFDELRASGIAVRYDPIADGVRLEK